jgi:glucosamine--fructose-6-phosphate aminotransferase (isomerizing)
MGAYMPTAGHHTYSEIITQPDAWAQTLEVGAASADALRALWRTVGGRSLLFTGCGSTYYLSLAAAALSRRHGPPARGLPASEVWLGTDVVPHVASGSVLVAVSRSGETTETLRAVETHRRNGGAAVIAVTCYPERTLAGMADLTISLPTAQEVSVAQTRSFASMLLACQLIVGTLAGDDRLPGRLAVLPALGRRVIEENANLAERLGADSAIERYFFLGSGARYGLAEEAMLKMKEMSLTYSEGYHPLEFRHGPMSMADGTALVVSLVSDRARAQEIAVVDDMRALGARTLAITEAGAGLADATQRVRLDSGLDEDERLILNLPLLQLIAYYRSIMKGLDPDRPRNLTAAVVLV